MSGRRGKIVLVTGVDAPWGLGVARRLLATGERHVIGVAGTALVDPPPGLDVVIAAVDQPRFVDLLRLEKVDTICHAAFRADRRPSEAGFEANVMATMQLVGAAATAGVDRLVVRSSTAVYGARHDNALYLKEDAPLRADRRYGYLRDWLEIERLLATRPAATGPEVTILRLANPIGRTPLSPLARLLQQPVAPVLLGFDPLMQVLAEEDAYDAFIHAVDAPVAGTFNIAADGVMPLRKLLALAGVPPLPLFHPLAYRGARWLQGQREGRFLFPLPPAYLRYPWLADTGHMKTKLGFTPRQDGTTAVRRIAPAVA